MFIVQCWIEHPVRKLDQTFTYLSDEETAQGCRVLVEFGTRTLTGFVESCEYTSLSRQEIEEEKGMKLKMISEIIDSEPLITEELHSLGLWMRDQTLSTAIACFPRQNRRYS